MVQELPCGAERENFFAPAAHRTGFLESLSQATSRQRPATLYNTKWMAKQECIMARSIGTSFLRLVNWLNPQQRPLLSHIVPARVQKWKLILQTHCSLSILWLSQLCWFIQLCGHRGQASLCVEARGSVSGRGSVSRVSRICRGCVEDVSSVDLTYLIQRDDVLT